ncbi:protein BIG GRAIN 1-like A [Malania oleifera]|uniref:protein BIG GRAIN 1-like A n=1 Tax=Malania oleifera TaxID=397392 RepID=UPI0025AE14B0|nr:protein BIG GRAIN 1-like A [Malania oleifera]
MLRWEKSRKEEGYGHERKNPSFSSSLLDEIYRSIDAGEAERGELGLYGKRMQRSNGGTVTGKENRAMEDDEMKSLQRACMIQKWMEKKVTDKVVVVEHRRKLVPEFNHRIKAAHYDHDALFFSSSCSSSDSSFGGFSSSETESAYGAKSQRPKSVPTRELRKSEKIERIGRTGRPPISHERRELRIIDDYRHNSVFTEQEPKTDESFIKSKSRALKIYNNLKKVKQPISPGGRLATFINSLFTAGSAKKSKSSSPPENFADDERKFAAPGSNCSSASSFSRSCLSKSSGKSCNGVKRSVTFYPVSVIVGEDSRPCGHKCLHEGEDAMEVLKTEAAKVRRSPSREILKVNYHQVQNNDHLMMGGDDEEDDAASYSSSDLFELDHLALVGSNHRYREELPVYETTHFDTNRAIAHGLIV